MAYRSVTPGGVAGVYTHACSVYDRQRFLLAKSVHDRAFPMMGADSRIMSIAMRPAVVAAVQ
jgi:hypothetical protein